MSSDRDARDKWIDFSDKVISLYNDAYGDAVGYSGLIMACLLGETDDNENPRCALTSTLSDSSTKAVLEVSAAFIGEQETEAEPEPLQLVLIDISDLVNLPDTAEPSDG